MHTGFTIAGIIVGAFIGYIAPMRSRLIPEGVGISIEVTAGVSLLLTLAENPSPWVASIGGVIVGHSLGAFVCMFTKH
ncbi:hypothetical protein [Prosthecobacter sp.]|uniref:hypothetical protein n=1 Tax=Prosthecobacter sp. TaxID=1965333 RepID=UPI003784BEDD